MIDKYWSKEEVISMESKPHFNCNNYGENLLSTFDSNAFGIYHFADDAYVYYFYKAKDQEEVVIDELKSFSVFFYKGDAKTVINIGNQNKHIKCNDTIQVENSSLIMKVDGGNVLLLIAGIRQSSISDSSVRITKYENIKKVSKPWGYELWINGEHPGYAIKKIHIHAGFRTSLQYHNFKRETNVLFEGNANLYFKSNDNVMNDSVKDSDISMVNINTPTIIDIMPKVLHRIESISDIILCEVSTPYLDDVVRVSDDKKRKDGRIEDEHK